MTARRIPAQEHGAQEPSAQQVPARLRRPGRRAVLLAGGGLAAAAVGAGATLAATGPSGAAPPDPAVIPPDDDLMREHGVLKRVLLVYRELVSRVQAGQRLPAAQANDAALIIHDFIEGFHEGLEEGYVFPRLRQAGQLESTVTTLLVQHARGRVLTQFILAHTPAGAASAGTAADLAAAMGEFVRMYEPHEAREDTVVFPAFRDIVPAGELASLGQHFADLEREQFGTDEFTAMVARITSIEQALGIYDLNQFTPDTARFAAQP